MELPYKEYDESEYIETDTGNKVSKKATIIGSHNIVLAGKTIIESGCVLRGDLRRRGPGNQTSFLIGRYCVLSKNTLFKPPCKIFKGVFGYFPMKISDHVFVGENSIVEAASIGSYVYIGKNCIIGRFAIIKDCVYIEDNSVISPNTVISSFSYVSGGPPAKIVESLPENTQETFETRSKDYYIKFIPK
ncbi:hypothetical protein BB559_002893 [Furculomyces boomerangus]|uniref:Dynactin subunit 5 n=2 Tax=Harpellales TaxID=61421 RepID=A0A2T9YRF0_9FUNG|nr:hypothetical protein BB559_002893 [Furculomyces boomerangus]PVZ97803.1 hypothetical protein BB558_006230 [Smittium angustum]PVZ98818.1 hypothetical protein BB558_005172 [Smittium angustum]PVZ99749.1 hypothetical protein BB558_004210 [Smittium angustum]